MKSHLPKLKDEQLAKFKELLENHHTWPTDYIFKFIVPAEKINEVKALFPNHKVSVRESSRGNYVALTVSIWALNADLVIAIYQQASEIEDLISL